VGLGTGPRILRALDAGADAALALVAAAPGFGKSTAVRTWCAGRSAAYAWVTLGASDNDPVRLWTYISTAVDRIRPSLGRVTLRRLRAAGDVAHAIDELLNGITGPGPKLGLDDLQTVTDSESLGSSRSWLARAACARPCASRVCAAPAR
jgi:LuxR family maltose regulon positive regulatory protein